MRDNRGLKHLPSIIDLYDFAIKFKIMNIIAYFFFKIEVGGGLS